MEESRDRDDELIPIMDTAPQRPKNPYLALANAVLEDAIYCYIRYYGKKDRRSRNLFDEVSGYVETKNATYPYSFEDICHFLNLEPDYVRKYLYLAVKKEAALGELDKQEFMRRSTL